MSTLDPPIRKRFLVKVKSNGHPITLPIVPASVINAEVLINLYISLNEHLSASYIIEYLEKSGESKQAVCVKAQD